MVEEKKKVSGETIQFAAVKDGKLSRDAPAQIFGWENDAERARYEKEHPNEYGAMGGVKYVPSGAPVRNTENIKKSNNAVEKIIDSFKNTDVNEVNEAIKIVGSGEWQNADTMKKYSDALNKYVDNYVALEHFGYFNSVPENERKGYVESLKNVKNIFDNNKKVFAQYKDEDSYKKSVNDYAEYIKVKNGDYKKLKTELKGWEKEWNAWNNGTNSTFGGREWEMHEWRYNDDGQRIIPYEATSYPEVFMGKTITEAKEIIQKRREYLRLVKKETQIENLVNKAQTSIDFEKVSQKRVCNSEKELLEKYSIEDFDSNNIELLVDYLCTDSKKVRESITRNKYTSYLETYGVMAAESVNLLNFDWSQNGYDQLDDEEKKIVKYYAKYDVNKLYEYLKLNEEAWKNRGAKIIAESVDGNILSQAAYAIAGAGDKIKQSIGGALNYITGKEDYVEPTKTQMTSQYIREDLEGLGGFLYDATGAVTYMAPGILMNAVLPGSGFAFTGVTAVGGAYNDGIKMGMTTKQARTYSTLIGVAEVGLSKAFSGIAGLKGSFVKNSVAKIADGVNNGIIKFVATAGVNAVSEGFEEFGQEVLEPLIENIALGYEKNSWKDIDWEKSIYNGLVGAFLGSTTNAIAKGSEIVGRNKYEINPDEVIAGIWDGSPDRENLKMKPEVINDIDTTLKKQLAFVDNSGQLTFIPTSVIITNTKVIAGTDVKSIFRDAKKYADKYGGKESDYRKVAGKIESKKYIFDIHFVKDAFGSEYDFKIKSKTLREDRK